ncbi:hypothetical protein [Cardiobacterium hominis]|jgi:hypothetical protein|uniref:hypothetical protein n=1 Tax=Cardiobacterium hominis TaxID=2718 RepID=UPI0028D1B776|nr:hypothetical protein [Cardiobacterium hominis]
MTRKRIWLLFISILLAAAYYLWSHWNACQPWTYIRNLLSLPVSEHCLTPKDKFMACNLSKDAIPKEKLFELAMQDYWKRRMNNFWEDDRLIESEYNISTTINDKGCGLERDRFGYPLYHFKTKHCYPWIMKKYNTIPKLETRIEEIRENSYNYNILVKDLLSGEVYDPFNDPPLYIGRNYNQNVDFSVIMRYGLDTIWFPQDCCRLYSFDEMVKEHVLLGPLSPTLSDKYTSYEYLDKMLAAKGLTDKDIYYLRIIYRDIDEGVDAPHYIGHLYHGVSTLYSEGSRYLNYIFSYFPVSYCGTLIR